MSNEKFIPADTNQKLYRNLYRVQSGKQYRYDHLDSLIDWWEHLDPQNNRYVFFTAVLTYANQADHKPENITNFLRALKRGFKVQGNKVSIDTIWKLEYRADSDRPEQEAMWYHYHVVIAFSREITPSTKRLKELMDRYWKHGVVFATATHLSGDTVYKNKFNKQLPYPVLNTDTTHYVGIFHHLTYLVKSDPKQALPKDYKGDEFRTSNRKKIKNIPDGEIIF